MHGAYLIPVGLAVPLATVGWLCVWHFRALRRARLRPGPPPTGNQLTELATGIYARQEQLEQQITALGQDLDERDRRLAAHVSSLIETAATAARIDPVPARPRAGPGSPEVNGRRGA